MTCNRSKRNSVCSKCNRVLRTNYLQMQSSVTTKWPREWLQWVVFEFSQVELKSHLPSPCSWLHCSSPVKCWGRSVKVVWMWQHLAIPQFRLEWSGLSWCETLLHFTPYHSIHICQRDNHSQSKHSTIQGNSTLSKQAWITYLVS